MQRSFRLPAVALATFLALVALIALASPGMAQRMVSIASTKEVNMRSGPGTRYGADWTLGHGYPLKVIGRQGKWLKVSDFENDKGWVYGPLTGSKMLRLAPRRAAISIARCTAAREPLITTCPGALSLAATQTAPS